MAYFPPTGSVVAFQQNPSSLMVGASIIGLTPVAVTNNPSVSGTVGASIVGQLPAGTAVLGSVAALQGTNPWQVAIVSGSVATATTNSSVMLLNGANVIGSVTALQGTNPWNISSVYGNVSGSVMSFQGGTWSPSAISYLRRNDTNASILGADLTYGPGTRDSAGRTITKPFSAEESRIEGYGSVVSTSVTTLVAAAGTGLRNYITDFFIANTGANTTLITFKDGAGSILGYTIAPTGGGSNASGIATPIRTGANATFDFQTATASSVVYATVKGFTAP